MNSKTFTKNPRIPSLCRYLCALVLWGLCLNSLPSLADAAPVKYRYPLSIPSGWTTYRDDDRGSGQIDWNNGKLTYGQHEGTDFAVAKGTPIYAGADGIVLEVVDGKFDDCRSGSCGPPSNRVKLQHKDGQITYYLHMKKWSIVVKKGQTVKCGQKLGEVASSGNSTGNHVHFQVGGFSASIEPFKGPKGNSISLWTSQGGYGRSNVVPGQQCDGNSTPACTNNTDCKDPAKPRCYQGECLPNPPAGCAFVKTTRLGGAPLNIRAQSNTSSSIVGSVAEGVCLPVLKTAQGQDISGNKTWYQITYNGVTGWVTAAFADCSNCGPACNTGDKKACYSGPAGTDGKGTCKKGSQTCSGGKWSACQGEVKPTTEQCNNKLDDDCDGQVDEGCTTNDCVDGKTQACYSGPAGTDGKGICKKGSQTCSGGKWGACQGEVKPTTEQCDNKLDDNCDGQIDEGCTTTPTCQDLDNDGFKSGSTCTGTLDCDDQDKNIHPNAPERCDNKIDDNCNGQVDEGCSTTPNCQDLDNDGFKSGSGCTGTLDCDDNDKDIHPNARETCGNGKDDNCNGQIDEGCSTSSCEDKDGDAVGTGAGCQGPQDCDDNNKLKFPGATDICGNGVDEDCDGVDAVCKKMGATGCKADTDCESNFCFLKDGQGTCSTRCPIQACPDDYTCVDNQACLPKNPGSVLPILCKNDIDCGAGRQCSKEQCLDKLSPRGCGCDATHSPDPSTPILFLLAFALLLRKRKSHHSTNT